MSSFSELVRPIVLVVIFACCSATYAEPFKAPPDIIANADFVSSAIAAKDALRKPPWRRHMVASRQTGREWGRPPKPAEPFALFGSKSPSAHDISAKWEELQSRIRLDEETLATCRANYVECPAYAREFLKIIDAARSLDGRAKIGAINRAINLKIRPMSDFDQYGIGDFWSAPLATLNAGAGDCEDYAIAKYLALREASIAYDQMRIIIGHDIKRMTDHAVVAVRFEGEWLILDNRHLILVNAEKVQYFLPLFIMDRAGVKEFSTAGIVRLFRSRVLSPAQPSTTKITRPPSQLTD